MVRDGLRQEEHPEQHGVRISVGASARDQRRYAVVERFPVEAGQRIESGKRIQIVVI